MSAIFHPTQVHLSLLFILLCRLKLLKAVIETNRYPKKHSFETSCFGLPALNIALAGILGKTKAKLTGYKEIPFSC